MNQSPNFQQMNCFSISHYLKVLSIILFCIILILGSVQIFAQASKPYPIKEINNLSYYDDPAFDSERTQVNLIIPEGVESPPVFMWIGGGAWAYVDRHKEMDLCRALARQGILMVSVGHRLSPQLLGKTKVYEGVQYPAHVIDLAHAFRWVYDHADVYGYSKKNIFVGGYSSGAHLSAMLASNGKFLEDVGLSTEDIRAIVPVAGGFDIPHYRQSLIEEDSSYLENHINPVFGTTYEEQVAASPMTFIETFHTPMLLISESETYQYTTLFEQALKDLGRDNFQVLNCHNETHNSLWTKLSKQNDCIYRDYILAYIKSMDAMKIPEK